MKKDKPLKRVVLINLLIGYTLIICSLAIYIRYLSVNVNNSIKEAGEATTAIYLNDLNARMGKIEDKCLFWYVSDNLGIMLESIQDKGKEFNITYKLSKMFKEEINGDKLIKAAFVVYDNFSSIRYSAQQNFDDRRIRALKECLFTDADSASTTDCWRVMYGCCI